MLNMTGISQQRAKNTLIAAGSAIACYASFLKRTEDLTADAGNWTSDDGLDLASIQSTRRDLFHPQRPAPSEPHQQEIFCYA